MGTIPGASGAITLTASTIAGSAGSNYLADFAAATANSTVTTLPAQAGVAGGLNVFTSGSDSISALLSTAGVYTYISTVETSSVTLVASGQTLLLSNVDVTETSDVGGERVTFLHGNNEFIGSASGVGEDTITAGDGYDTISTSFDGASTVFGGAHTTITLDGSVGGGDLVVAEGGSDTISATALAGDTIFAAGGANITLINAAGDPQAVFVAGAGNETLDGSGAAGSFAYFADTTAGDSVTDSVIGGSGFDFFSTGVGTEDFTAGSGGADFEINDVGGTITINDFGAGDSVNFAGLSVADEQSLAAQVSASSSTVTLANGTTVDFVGVTSLSGHLF